MPSLSGLPSPPGLPSLAGLGARLPDPLAPLRDAIGGALREVFSADRLPGEQYDAPAGDPGWFGPGSVTWRVHADPSMLIGGLAALMLQTLHPLAMAGVAEHSDFRERPLERLGRTSSFVTSTTYGSTPVAERMVRTVRAIHRKVVGIAPDGRPYSASDPDLLRWVHVSEFHAFARTHQHYAWRPVSGRAVDRYYDEVAVIATELGATDVPRTRGEVAEYFREVRPELVYGDQAREAIRFILRPIQGPAPLQAAYLLVVQAALGSLPTWARRMMRLPRLPGIDAAVVRPATRTVLAGLSALGGEPLTVTAARARAAG